MSINKQKRQWWQGEREMASTPAYAVAERDDGSHVEIKGQHQAGPLCQPMVKRGDGSIGTQPRVDTERKGQKRRGLRQAWVAETNNATTSLGWHT
jgi:hypothetical protein